MNRVYNKSTVLPDSTKWWPLSSPIAASSVVVKNAGAVDVLIRTDPTEADSQDILTPGLQECLVSDAIGTGYRFLPGVPFLFARTSNGSGKLIISALA